jgi:hypothetical protein
MSREGANAGRVKWPESATSDHVFAAPAKMG